MAACSSCGARIFWAKTEKGKSIPIDYDPRPDGNLWFYCDVVYPRVMPGAMRFVAHFATCPNAKKHRKERT
jgi:hypothetical protein